MHLTVAICTRNRCAALGRTLETITRIIVPDGVSWELIVADNGSDDAIASTLEHFARVLPLRAIDAPTVGKSHALNAAMDAARGEYVLWIDDDVLVDPMWMQAYHDAFMRWPDVA